MAIGAKSKGTSPMSFSVGLQHANNTITWLYDFQMQELMFHDITEFFSFYLRNVFTEKRQLDVWTIRKAYDEFDRIFGTVATVLINPNFYSYDTDKSLLHIPVESGTVFFSCKIGDTFEYVTLKTHKDNRALEAMFKRAKIMNPDGMPDPASVNRVNCTF